MNRHEQCAHDACMQPLYNGKDGSFVFPETTIERHTSYNLSFSLSLSRSSSLSVAANSDLGLDEGVSVASGNGVGYEGRK